MHFCEICDNMFYIRISSEDNNKLIYYCRNCGNENKTLGMENTCILKTKINKQSKVYSHIVNEYTKKDITLPRINTVRCPNQKCKSNTEENIDNEVIYIRYDHENMKYIYICVNCDTKWKTNEQK